MLSFAPRHYGSVLALLLLVAIGPAFAGCAKQEFQNMRQPTHPVQGQVTLDGKPVANATIVFKPVDAAKFKWREQPQAKSDAEGRFTVFTYEANDGAPAGEYRVGIAVLGGGDDEGGTRSAVTPRLPRFPPVTRMPPPRGSQRKSRPSRTRCRPSNCPVGDLRRFLSSR
jgi:hypothetical protein